MMSVLFFQVLLTADTFISSAAEKENQTFDRLQALSEDMKRIEDLKAGLAQAQEQNTVLRERHDFLKEAFDALSD